MRSVRSSFISLLVGLIFLQGALPANASETQVQSVKTETLSQSLNLQQLTNKVPVTSGFQTVFCRLTSNYSGTACTSYAYDNAGNRTSLTKGNCATSTTTTHTYSSASQLTNSGYVYDQLGRNTSIPAVDAPKPSNGVITLTYNANDTIAAITQNATTSFTYDAEARRLNENSGSQTTTRHYTDESDNPTWVTQTGTNRTEIYTSSLGPGLNITTTLQNATKTAELQLTDLRGNTATTIDLATSNPSQWSSYDEFGNPTVTNPTNTNLVNYTTYAQAERATNTTGLVLMGARVYNPVTNQFTSPDPVKGGNENRYTYPNDPLNYSDISGQIGFAASYLLDGIIGTFATAIGFFVCGPFGLFCRQALVFIINLLVDVVINLLDGEAFVIALGHAVISAGLSLIPGMSKKFFKRIARAVAMISNKVAKNLKRIKLKKIKREIDSTLTAWDFGVAVGQAVQSGDWLRNLIF